MAKTIGNALLVQQAKSFSKVDSGSGAMFGNAYANALWLGTAGDVALVLENDDVIVLSAALAGMWHSMPPFKRINSTNTTATLLVVGATFQ